MSARALGIDLGDRRIGIALAAAGGHVATPLAVIQRAGSRQCDHAQIAKLASEYEAEILVVGLPISLDGQMGVAAKRTTAEVKQLADAVKVPVITHDERFTTVIAERSLAASGLSAKARRQRVDMVAAAVILQGWLDTQNALR